MDDHLIKMTSLPGKQEYPMHRKRVLTCNESIFLKGSHGLKKSREFNLQVLLQLARCVDFLYAVTRSTLQTPQDVLQCAQFNSLCIIQQLSSRQRYGYCDATQISPVFYTYSPVYSGLLETFTSKLNMKLNHDQVMLFAYCIVKLYAKNNINQFLIIYVDLTHN